MADDQRLLATRTPAAVRAVEAISDLATAAFIDRKSGLLNAAALEIFREEYDRDPKATAGVVFVDLAGFKAVNERHGHAAGDTAIRVAGTQLRTLANEHTGQAYRYGGDEFVVVVASEQLTAFVKAANQQMRVIVLTWEGDERVEFGATFGYCRPFLEATLETLITNADMACRRAKALDGKPREWSATDTAEVPDSIRRKCDACRTTTTVLVYPSKRKEACLSSCPNCGVTMSSGDAVVSGQ